MIDIASMKFLPKNIRWKLLYIRGYFRAIQIALKYPKYTITLFNWPIFNYGWNIHKNIEAFKSWDKVWKETNGSIPDNILKDILEGRKPSNVNKS